MEELIQYTRSNYQDHKDFTIHVDYVITIVPKSTVKLFNVNGYDTECIINLENTNTDTECIEANVKFELSYNLYKEPSPFVLKDVVPALNPVNPIGDSDKNHYNEAVAGPPTISLNAVSAHENAFEGTKYKLEDEESDLLYADISNYTHESEILDAMDVMQVPNTVNLINSCCATIDTNTISQSQAHETTLMAFEETEIKIEIDDEKILPLKYEMNLTNSEINEMNANLKSSEVLITQTHETPFIAFHDSKFKIDIDDGQMLSETNLINPQMNETNMNLTSNSEVQINSTTTELDQLEKLHPSDEINSNTNLLLPVHPDTIFCNYCGNPFNTYNDLKQHIKKSICKNCNTHFAAMCELKVHRNRCARCNLCKQLFQDVYTRRRHNKPLCIGICNICNVKFKTICLLQQHKLSDHPGFHMCATCDSFYETEAEQDHILDPNKSYQCVKCKCVFASICLMKIHQKFCYKCNSCNVILKNIQSTKDHRSKHSGYYCCKKRFTSLCMFNRHINRPHCIRQNELSKYKFECKTCLNLFESEQMLNIHSKEHASKCDICNKICRDEKHLKKHKVVCIRLNRDGYICPTCGVTVTSQYKLTNHMVTHSDDRPYPCDICGKRFKTRLMCRRHKVVHTDVKLFACNICNKNFKTRTALRFHAKMHLNLQEFKCVVCHEGFNRKDALQIHMSKHKLSKDFKCEICGKEFPVKYHLNWHMKEHTEEHQFKCDTCKRGFVHRQSFKAHRCKLAKQIREASESNKNDG